ncbi:hypothetical protein CH25_gp24 [Mycobacterium phage EagleEye]|uniref:Uncharacterized protein n=1 Tax=Mycobacterium phage EagleEye TaxID=1429759 RepID=W0LN36_9CAUD|nr:hypothetical protein CH25_gp24 [Mycobacterium phage EagleEye]AHG23862.1 hypothetical protein PBI_EAGLEEYE_82 [Mycobacterium phage EagleEye]
MSDPVKEFTEVWSDSWLADQVGPMLTCTEAEALAALMLGVGKPEVADAWIKSHATSDDCGDMHCSCNYCRE